MNHSSINNIKNSKFSFQSWVRLGAITSGSFLSGDTFRIGSSEGRSDQD